MAVYKNISINDIKELLVNSIQIKFNIVFRMLGKSFINIVCTVFAGVFVVLYKQIGWLFLQLFPETSYWGDINVFGKRIRPLVQWGDLIGVGEPKTGSQWKGKLRIYVTTIYGNLIAGTQLKSDVTGKLYITEDSILLDSETVTVSVVCTENGSSGNLEANDILSFVNPLGNVQKTATIESVTEIALDDETESEYRQRVISRFRNPPLGGALSDYRRWASDVAGVLNTYPYKDENSANGVIVYVSGIPVLFPERIPSTELLVQVGNACTYDPTTGLQSRKPMTAVIDPRFDGTYTNVRPVSIARFDVRISGVTGVPLDDFVQSVKPALENYLFGREPYIRGLSDDSNKINIVSKNTVYSVIDQAARQIKAEFESAAILKSGIAVQSYSLKAGELATLENLFVNGIAA